MEPFNNIDDVEEGDFSDYGNFDDIFNVQEDTELSADYRHELEAQVRRQIEGDDPNLIRLEMGLDGYHPPHYSLKPVGEIIGKNTKIRELVLDEDSGISTECNWAEFFCGVAHNRSIQKLIFRSCNLYSGKIFTALVPFFKGNSNFESLEMVNCELGDSCIHLLITTLAKFDSLKEFFLQCEENDEINGRRVIQIFQALSAHSDLRKLVMRAAQIGMGGCSEVATLLQNPNCKLAEVDLSANALDDEGAANLAKGMAGNGILKDLTVALNEGVSETGWQTIFSSFQSPNFALEHLNLAYNDFEDEEIVLLSNALTGNSSLRVLTLCGNCEITMVGWEAFSCVLQNPNCALEDLLLSSNRINHETINFIIDALNSNTALKKLDLSNNMINDEGINNLTNALVNNVKLMELNLRGNSDATATGWEAFAAVFQSPVSALETLNLESTFIADATMVSLANSIVNNSMLKELLIAQAWHLSPERLAVFAQILCNTASVMDTYQSNHTLQKLGRIEIRLPEDLRSLLKLNKGNSESRAARLKIIQTHFREGFTVAPFVDMEQKILPYAIGWMGKDGSSHELNQHFYGFLRSMPSLFDVEYKHKKRAEMSDIDGKKRKRKIGD